MSVKGAFVRLNTIHPGSQAYISNCWQMIEGLGIDQIIFNLGQEGNVWHTDMTIDPNWAQNLDALLSLTTSHGVKTVFHAMGTAWGGILGIVPPSQASESGPVPVTPIATAKTRITALAGNNALAHNFITDPRIAYWYTDNEPDISIPSNLDWIVQISDHIRSYGGKVVVGSPRVANWDTGMYFSATEPLLRNHVDYLEYHLYGLQPLVSTFTNPNGSRNWAAYEDWWKSAIQTTMLDGRGNFAMNQLIVGEYGMFRGYGSSVGVTTTFTDEDRRQYFTIALRAMKAKGIVNWNIEELFRDITSAPPLGTFPEYALVGIDGAPFPYCYDIVRAELTGQVTRHIKVRSNSNTRGILTRR